MDGEHGLGLHRTFTEEFLIMSSARFKVLLIAYQLTVQMPEVLNLQMGPVFCFDADV